MIIYECPWPFANDEVIRAWAFWIVTNQGFACKIGTWGYDKGKRPFIMLIHLTLIPIKDIMEDTLRSLVGTPGELMVRNLNLERRKWKY